MEIFTGCSLVAQTVKRLPTMQETWVWSLGREAPLEKEMATHSSTLAWRIPWTEEPCRLQSVGSQRVGHDWATSLPSTSFLPYKLCKYLEIIMYLSTGHLVLLLVSIWAKEYALNPVKNLSEFKVDFSLLKANLFGSAVVKNPPANAGDARDMGKLPWRRRWQPTPVFLPGKSHGQRSLVGYSPWVCKEADTTECALPVKIQSPISDSWESRVFIRAPSSWWAMYSNSACSQLHSAV